MTKKVSAVAEERSQRILALRKALRFSRQKLSDKYKKYGITTSALQSWEDIRWNGLTEKGAHALAQAFQEEGLQVTTEWLLFGIGSDPLENFLFNLPHFEETTGHNFKQVKTLRDSVAKANDTHCVFCDIVNNETPAHIVFEDDDFVIFLDRHPLFLGHCLLITKQHYPTVDDLPDTIAAKIFIVIKKLSYVVKTTMQAEGVFIASNNTVSQSVPHFHVHVVPRTKGDGLKGFFWPRQMYNDEEEMGRISELLKTAWNNI